MNIDKSGLEAAAKVVFARETDARDPGYLPWDKAGEDDRIIATRVAADIVQAYLQAATSSPDRI